MTDKFLSGWGMAEGKIAKFVYECETYKIAEIVVNNANNRTDQKNVNITTKKPYYNQNTHYTTYNRYYDSSGFYKKDYFKQRALSLSANTDKRGVNR